MFCFSGDDNAIQGKSNGVPMKILDAPVHLGSLAGDMVKAVQKNTSAHPDIMQAQKECTSVSTDLMFRQYVAFDFG